MVSSGYWNQALGSLDQRVFMATRNIDFIKYAISYVKDSAEVVLSDETAIGEYLIESCRAAALFKSGGQ